MKPIELPEGAKDMLPATCAAKRSVQRKMRDTFASFGYAEVQTPVFEYLDTFAYGQDSLEPEKMLRFFEAGKKTMVLRPDATMPIARVAVTKMRGDTKPIRLCYIEDIYRYEQTRYGVARRSEQAGAELIGAGSVEADAEIIALAVESLLALGIEDFQIDIGEVDFFKGLAEASGITDETQYSLGQWIDAKDMGAIEGYLSGCGLPESFQKTVRALPRLYGGYDMLEKACNLSDSPRCVAAIDSLSALYGILKAYGYGAHIAFDLGMVQSLHYYTGMVFRGYIKDHGMAVLKGGRYDHLTRRYGEAMPATGYAVNIDEIMKWKDRQSEVRERGGVQALVVFDAQCLEKGYTLAKKMRMEGKRVEIFLPGCGDPIEYANRKKIPQVLRVHKELVEEIEV